MEDFVYRIFYYIVIHLIFAILVLGAIGSSFLFGKYLVVMARSKTSIITRLVYIEFAALLSLPVYSVILLFLMAAIGSARGFDWIAYYWGMKYPEHIHQVPGNMVSLYSDFFNIRVLSVPLFLLAITILNSIRTLKTVFKNHSNKRSED